MNLLIGCTLNLEIKKMFSQSKGRIFAKFRVFIIFGSRLMAVGNKQTTMSIEGICVNPRYAAVFRGWRPAGSFFRKKVLSGLVAEACKPATGSGTG